VFITLTSPGANFALRSIALTIAQVIESRSGVTSECPLRPANDASGMFALPSTVAVYSV